MINTMKALKALPIEVSLLRGKTFKAFMVLIFFYIICNHIQGHIHVYSDSEVVHLSAT